MAESVEESGVGPLGAVLSCGLHLDSRSDAVRAAQVREFLAWRPGGRDLTAYGTVVVGGDFNAEPSHRAMAPLYAVGQEADGGPGTWRHPTHEDGRKLDYLFTWSRGAGPRWQDSATGTLATPNSDHLVLHGRLG
ncbi:hypothetical protein GL263_16955 [Streptomyces durbertensis]|uniref:Endonuclease/exonuclease/phosphatase domain-containing protein n=1 Tax=Streptomyces durbertensis TaxID=2448886 RepID=A0ABR6EIV6_9ACTN|nr:endonuclease/exonuclease/phosphatase family protein [Streptomyces durbertensis]MBB1245245.1 hypothetical protein [Streptomyces durbertensis]